MGDDKIRFNLNCDEQPEWLYSDSKQLLGNIDMTLNCGEPFTPINPETNESYLHSVFEENDAMLTDAKPQLSVRDRINSGFESAIQAQLKE